MTSTDIDTRRSHSAGDPRGPKYPGVETVINGNGAVAYVMGHVCGGVIGYPITPSTEISELFEARLAEGGLNVWGKHAFFFEPEGEHSAQSGALGAALTGGQFISNASSSQGILYAMESHYVTVGKKVGGFVLQIAARVVSKHSLNVMAGHDDVYALLPSGYTVLFGANPQEAADLAAISYRASALSLIPVANCMDGFSTSHMLSEALLPEPELLREFVGDPQSRIPCPTVAQDLLFGDAGRVAALQRFAARHAARIEKDDYVLLRAWLDEHAAQVETDTAGDLVGHTVAYLPQDLVAPWRRAWTNAHTKGTRQLVPALVDPNNPGLTGPVQNQPDFQAGAVDHRTHFASEVPRLVRQAMAEYGALTGRVYQPVHTSFNDDAEVVMIALGSVADDVEAVLPYLRSQGMKAGLVSVKLLQPFPEAEIVAALAGKRAVVVLERSDQMALTPLVTSALMKGLANARTERHPGIPALAELPVLSTAVFGLGGHDLQPRHLVAAFRALDAGTLAPLVYLGSQFYSKTPSPYLAGIQDRLRSAYPETELMALDTDDNPNLLPAGGMRIRFHSVGGYGTIATGKLLTDILAGVLDMHSKAAPKYGSEKSGAPTNYYITLSPDPIRITNADLEDVEIVLSPDHKVFHHTNPLKGIADGGTFMMQSNLPPLEVWRDLPASARRTIRERHLKFFVLDAFSVALKHAPQVDLQTRMMGIAFVGAVTAHVDRVTQGAPRTQILEKVRSQIAKKFGSKGAAVVEANMAVIIDGIDATKQVEYTRPEYRKVEQAPAQRRLLTVDVSEHLACDDHESCGSGGLFDRQYYETMIATPFREGTIGEAPVLPGTGLFIPPGTAAGKDKGLFRRNVPMFDASLCTGCLECTLVCPDAAIPNTIHEVPALLQSALEGTELTAPAAKNVRETMADVAAAVPAAYGKDVKKAFSEVVAEAVALVPGAEADSWDAVIHRLAAFPVARTRPFYDAMEKGNPGKGGLYSVVIDPWKCTGCLECIDVCGPHALNVTEQTNPLQELLQQRFEFLSRLPATPDRFVESGSGSGGPPKRLFLDRSNYYATTGGHGGCRGCGEVTATRQVMAASHAIGGRRRKSHQAELEQLVADVQAKLAQLAGTNGADSARRERLGRALSVLERRLYDYEGGASGGGPATTVVTNSTGCSSVYASTMPFNAFTDPWVNSLFQDAQPLAKGIFEGIAAQATTDVRAIRTARLELADAYDEHVHDPQLATMAWTDFTAGELEQLPTIMTIGGDGASYDIGFGALSRILSSSTPLKIMVLNTGAYSNTGGQSSTSSFHGQDSDLSRVGSAHGGKKEVRKELGILASFHPGVYVCSSATAVQSHFLRNVMDFLTYTEGPSVLDVYTPCQSEHGIDDSAANMRAKLAVASRMNPVFVHDPRRGETLHDWFWLEGNPDPDKTWSSQTLEVVDGEGNVQLVDTVLTPGHFAFGETRFRKHFKRLSDSEAAMGILLEEYLELPEVERSGHVPYILVADASRKLVRYRCDDSIVAMSEGRRRNWHLLQYMAGRHVASLSALHKRDVEALQAQYDAAMKQREASLDEIAQAMSELAASATTSAPVAPVSLSAGVTAAPARPAAAAAPTGPACSVPVSLAAEDQPLCTDCKTCYTDLPEIFERTKLVVDGVAKDVARVIPGVLDTLTVTDDIERRIRKVIATCDAEIIR